MAKFVSMDDTDFNYGDFDGPEDYEPSPYAGDDTDGDHFNLLNREGDEDGEDGEDEDHESPASE